MLIDLAASTERSWPGANAGQASPILLRRPEWSTGVAWMRALARLSAFRDPGLYEHVTRVQALTSTLVMALARTERGRELTSSAVRDLQVASFLHDLGKMFVPRSLRLKPGRLTAPEFEAMATHTTRGARLISLISRRFRRNRALAMAFHVAHCHHERWDGTGYPRRLVGEQIPLHARIVAVADVYDALRSKRSYKSGMTHRESRELIIRGAGAQFDPWVVDGFLDAEIQMSRTWESLADARPESSEAEPRRAQPRPLPVVQGFGGD